MRQALNKALALAQELAVFKSITKHVPMVTCDTRSGMVFGPMTSSLSTYRYRVSVGGVPYASQNGKGWFKLATVDDRLVPLTLQDSLETQVELTVSNIKIGLERLMRRIEQDVQIHEESLQRNVEMYNGFVAAGQALHPNLSIEQVKDLLDSNLAEKKIPSYRKP